MNDSFLRGRRDAAHNLEVEGVIIMHFYNAYYSEDRVIEHYKQLKGVSRGHAIVQ